VSALSLQSLASVALGQEVQTAREEFQVLQKDAQERQILLMMRKAAAFSHQPHAPVEGNRGTSCDTSDASDRGTSCNTSEVDEACPTSADEQGCDTSEEELSSIAPAPLAKRIRKYPKDRCAPFSMNFLGVPVCQRALARFVGVGWSRIQRVMEGRLDLRTEVIKGQHGQTLKRPRRDGVFNNVMDFFWLIRCSEAEALPTKFDLNRAAGEVLDGESDSDTSSGKSIDLGTALDYVEEEQRVARSAALWAAQMQSWESTVRDTTENTVTVRRYVAWSRKTELYWQYCAYAAEAGCKVATYTSFMRVFNVVFGKDTGFLRFKKKSGQHATCTACDGYKCELRSARHVQARAAILEDFAVLGRGPLFNGKLVFEGKLCDM